MKTLLNTFLWITFLVFLASGQTTEFTYQGKLTDGGDPVSTPRDLRFRLWDADLGGNMIGSEVTVSGVAFNGGIFTVQLDFGQPDFGGDSRWIETAVSLPGANTYSVLAPRQKITSVPYAVKSLGAVSSESVDCSLCITDAHIVSIDGGKVNGPVAQADMAALAGNVTGVIQTEHGGTGSTVKNFVDLTTNQSVAGDKMFTNTVGVTGSNGVFNGNGSGLTNLNGANIVGGTITTTQLAADAVPNSSSLRLLGMKRWDVLKREARFGTALPHGIVFDGSNIWVASVTGGTVTKIRVSDGSVIGSYPTANGPRNLVFDGAYIWAACTTGFVTKIRASDGTLLGNYPVSGAWGIAFDGSQVWVTTNTDSVVRLRASDGTSLGSSPVGVNPVAIAFDGRFIWVVNSNFAGSISKLDPESGQTIATYPVGANPQGILFDGTNIWVSVSSAGSVLRFRASDGATLGSIAVGGNPAGLVFDGSYVWVMGSQPITKIRASDGTVLGTYTTLFPTEQGAFDGSNVWATLPSGSHALRLAPAFPQPN